MLLRSLGCGELAIRQDNRSAKSLWQESGGLWLTGLRNEYPRQCSAPVASAMRGAWLALCALHPGKLDPKFDAHCLLGERAALAKLQRAGQVSAGGAARLLQTVDGWLALNLAREDDWTLLPAWLENEVDDLQNLRTLLTLSHTENLVARGRMMGLAVAALPKRLPACSFSSWITRQRLAAPVETLGRQPLVLDLSSLWAGPLCAQILQDCGARVIRVESTKRPDGARFGVQSFFDLLNGGKESVALRLDTQHGRSCLKGLLTAADIVIEGSRPRALENMGIDAARFVAQGQVKVWLSITGYGRAEGNRDWIAFGDDAAVAAGLSNTIGLPPVFCSDAVADPLTGLHAAVAVLQSWLSGGGELLDVSLFSVAQSIASLANLAKCEQDNLSAPLPMVSDDISQIQRPRARAIVSKAVALGTHTDAVIEEFLGAGQRYSRADAR